MNDLGKRVAEVANQSSDAETLEKGLTSLVNEYSVTFPQNGKAVALHEVTSQMFNNNATHFPFFPDFALMAYEANLEIGRWHWAERIAEPMVGLEIKLFAEHGGSGDSVKDWFRRWIKAVEIWSEEDVDTDSWPSWGTGILNRCEVFSNAAIIQDDVYGFWNSIIEAHGAFAPLEETLARHQQEFAQLVDLYQRDMDSGQWVKRELNRRVNLLSRLEVEDLVDRMNMIIELIPGTLTPEELEIKLSQMEGENDPLERCALANSLATKLRLDGNLDLGIEVLSRAIDMVEDVTKNDVTSMSTVKLGIYLDEAGRKDEAESLFRKISDAEHGPDLVNIRTVDGACQRLATLLAESERYEESKEYTKVHNSLAEMMGDAFLFVRSCFNVVADCHELGQKEEAEEWFVLGMANLRDGITVGSIHADNQRQLLEQSSNIATLIGRQHAWQGMMQHIFQQQEK